MRPSLAIIVLLACADGRATSRATAEGDVVPAAAGEFRGIAPMSEARYGHTATALADGRVLVAGGSGASLELFVPDAPDAKGVAGGSWRSGGRMLEPRLSHTATRLRDGRVLLAGGYGAGREYLASAELYDPRSGRVVRTGPMTAARAGHVAVLLADGRVLVVGGVGTGWTFLSSAEVYDPATNAFVATGAMRVPRESHVAVALPDGSVLVVGGHAGRRADIVLYASSERWHPAADGGRGAFRPAGDMTIRRHKHDAVVLADGRVLVTGGSDERDDRGAYASAELYDPRTGRFARVFDLGRTRYKHAGTSVRLEDGSVVVAGGAAAPERWDPQLRRFVPIPAAPGTDAMRGAFSAAAPLRGGSVLVTGGYGGGRGATSGAWVIVPPPPRAP